VIKWLPRRREATPPAPAAVVPPGPEPDEPGPPPAPPDPEIAARLERLKQRHVRPGMDADAAVADFTAALGTPATRSATLLLSAPLAQRLRAERHTARSREVAAAALELVTGTDLRAMLRAELLLAELDAGEVPDSAELAVAASDLMAIADRHVEGSAPAKAARWLRCALDLLLHRALHCDDLVSPFADDAAGFLAPLHGSRTYRALKPAPGAGEDRPRPRARAGGRPLRLLFVTGTHVHFLRPVLERYADREDVEIRHLDIGRPAADAQAFPSLAALTVERLTRLAGSAQPRQLGPAAALDLLAWADTVFVEWCDNAAVWASLAAPPGTRLVVRLHSVEALSVHPHLLDWSRVDDLVLVSAPLEALLGAVAPATADVRRHVLPNPIRLAEMPADKLPEADRTVGMVGWSSPVKDPVFALDVLARLREHDPAWRLVLLGAPFPASQRPRSVAYQHRFEERLRADPEFAAAVVRLGHVSPVARPDVGFVLSCSLREAFPVGIMEGTAGAAVPIFRNWPVLRTYGGPRALVPAEWVVEDVEAAVARILAHADPARRTEAGLLARRIILDRYDWSTCAARYDALLLT
jgi:glycosyltransferase involved in cell wall biosynthesis